MKLVLELPKEKAIQRDRLKANDVIYVLIQTVLSIADECEINTQYVKTLRRILKNNFSKLKRAANSKGIRIEE